MFTDLYNLWNEAYNSLKGIVPILVFLSFIISLLVLLFGNNWLGFISVKFISYTQGSIYKFEFYEEYPNWFTFVLPLEITPNTETEIIGAELCYRDKKTANHLYHSVHGEIDPTTRRDFSIPLKKNIAAKYQFMFFFGGKVAEKYHKEVANHTVNDAPNSKNGKRKYTQFKKFILTGSLAEFGLYLKVAK